MEEVDTGDLKSPDASRAGSSPAGGSRVGLEGFLPFTSKSSFVVGTRATGVP